MDESTHIPNDDLTVAASSIAPTTATIVNDQQQQQQQLSPKIASDVSIQVDDAQQPSEPDVATFEVALKLDESTQLEQQQQQSTTDDATTTQPTASMQMTKFFSFVLLF